MRASTIWTAANVAMLLVFAVSVAVQYNDPDPGLWIGLYDPEFAVALAQRLLGHLREAAAA